MGMSYLFLSLQLLGFLNTLCGPKASNLKVKDMDKYAFNPSNIVVQIVSIMVRVWIQNQKSTDGESFATSLASHPDFSQTTMTKCSSVLQKTVMMDSELLGNFASFLEQVNYIQGLGDMWEVKGVQPRIGEGICF